MPFKSEKQRRFLWAEHPEIAKRWAHEYPTKKKLPMYASDSKKEPESDTDSKKADFSPGAAARDTAAAAGLSTLGTTAGLAAAGMLSKRVGSPMLQQLFNNAARESVLFFNPMRSYRLLKRLPNAAVLSARQLELSDKLVNSKLPKTIANVNKSTVNKATKAFNDVQQLQNQTQRYVKQHGELPTETLEKGIGVANGVMNLGVGGVVGFLPHVTGSASQSPINAAFANKPPMTTYKQSAVNSVALDIYRKLSKQAETKEVYIEQPASDKPTVAGENPPKVVKTKGERCNSETKPNNEVNPLLAKISAVLSQPIMQAIENERAEMEAREAARMPTNAGIKRYAMPAMGTPLPMGMQAQAPQAQPQAPAAQPANMGSPAPSGQLPPVGGGSSPNANPINSYGALSSTGEINGNAAFGTAHSAGGEKLAVNLGAIGRAVGKAVGGVVKKPMAAAAKPAFKMPANPTYADLAAYGKQIGYGEKMPRYTHQEFANYQLMRQRLGTKPAAGAGQAATPAPVARPAPAARPAAPVAAPVARPAPVAAPAARPAAPPVARPATTAPAKPLAGAGDELSLDDDIINSMAAFGKTSASSPAWQRSAGKNPEGGLNEKGRKSYERETGGNLKAPVTESNPKGERAKRQNSFCSRMCGMKRVNTGSKTKSDPDSRINKSLRKWNCKCSSAMEFGAKLAAEEVKKKEPAKPGLGHSMGWYLGGMPATNAAIGVPLTAYMNRVARPDMYAAPTMERNRAWQQLSDYAKSQGVDVVDNLDVARRIDPKTSPKATGNWFGDLMSNIKYRMRRSAADSVRNSPAFYTPANPGIGISKPTIGHSWRVKNPGVLAHEIGHHMGGKWLMRGNVIGRPSIGLGTAGALLSNNEDNSRNAAIAGTVGSVPMLASEFDASRRGAKLMRQMKLKGGRSAFIGLPTYMLASSAPMLAHYGKKTLGGFKADAAARQQPAGKPGR